MSQLKALKMEIRLTVSNPSSESDSAFGKGVANLCLGVRNLGSLNAAAKSMGMAYSKAWRIIKDTESALDIQLLNRDGAHGSELTNDGNLLLDSYLAIEAHLAEETQALYDKAVG